MALKIKLIKSYSGAPETQLRTIAGLGLKKFNQERILKDTPEIRGMIFKVKHLVSHEVVQDVAEKTARRKPRHVRAREQARAKRAAEAK